jgi:hypothetical protein
VHSRIAGFARGVSKFVFRTLLVLVAVEGIASWIGFALAVPEGILPPEPERLHMRYDPELGWAHVPNTRLDDFYGPGRNLTINTQGFRGTHSYEPQPPEGHLRAICSGDSFTLGVGVNDSDTWCAQLEALEPRLETLNLGQGGYGLDQAYLWYRRDGVAFDTDVLIFAFVREDFSRMESDTFRHYGKPLLRSDSEGHLEVRNVPVPNSSAQIPWLVRNAQLFEQLRIVQLAEPALRALERRESPELTVGELSDLVGNVFAALQRLSDEQGSTLVLVYLPTREDYDNPGDLWRQRVAREARRHGIVFVDLVEQQKRLSRSEVAELYLPGTSPESRGANAPFSESGNAWVAESVRATLRGVPELAEALGPAERSTIGGLSSGARPWQTPSTS